jgi:hypothetical protein
MKGYQSWGFHGGVIEDSVILGYDVAPLGKSRILEGTFWLHLQRRTGPRRNAGNRLPILSCPRRTESYMKACRSLPKGHAFGSFVFITPSLLFHSCCRLCTHMAHHLTFFTGVSSFGSPEHWRMWQRWNEICALVRYYAASSGNPLLTFRHNI